MLGSLKCTFPSHNYSFIESGVVVLGTRAGLHFRGHHDSGLTFSVLFTNFVDINILWSCLIGADYVTTPLYTCHIVTQYITLPHMSHYSTVCQIVTQNITSPHMPHFYYQTLIANPCTVIKEFSQIDRWVIHKSSVGMHGIMWPIFNALSSQNWRDDYLTWNSSDFSGIQKIMLPLAEIWIPDVAVENSAESVQGHFSRNTDSYGVVWNTGKTIISIFKMWLKRILLVHAATTES